MHEAIRGLEITLLPQFTVAEALASGLVVVLPDYRLGDLAIEVLYPVSQHLSVKTWPLVEFLRDRFSTPSPKS